MARQKSVKTCQRCGQTNLWWKNDAGSWRLADDTGRIHSCKQFNRDGRGNIPVPSTPEADKFNAPKWAEFQGTGQGQQSESQGQSQDSYKSDQQGQGEAQGQGQGEQQGEQGKDQGASQEQQQGEQGQQGDEGKDLKFLTTDQPVDAKGVFKAIKPEVEWTVAQQLSSMKQQLDSRFGRNEAALTEAVNKHVQAKLDEINGPTPIIEVHLPDGTKIDSGSKTTDGHPCLTELIMLCGMRKNVLLVGPAGTGKTTAAEKAATALNLKFYPFSVGAQTSKTDIAGYQDAHSRLVRSIFRDAYEHGGIFLLDEVDAGNANVLTLLNSALSNGYFSFPDGVLAKHGDFVCVAAGNTYGNGADRQYVGRNQLDAATLDRFITIDWDYDTKLEKRLAKSQPEWLEYIYKLRRAREKTGVRAVFSTRAIINGTDLLNAGWKRDRVEAVVLWNRISVDDREKLQAAARS